MGHQSVQYSWHVHVQNQLYVLHYEIIFFWRYTKVLTLTGLHGPMKRTQQSLQQLNFLTPFAQLCKTSSRWLDKLKTSNSGWHSEVLKKARQRLWRQLNHCKNRQLYQDFKVKQSRWRQPAYRNFFISLKKWWKAVKLIVWQFCPSSGLPQSFLSFVTELPVMCMLQHPSI